MSNCNTSDGIDHRDGHVEDCLESVIERYEDGFVFCPILWSGGSCEECGAKMEGAEEE